MENYVKYARTPHLIYSSDFRNYEQSIQDRVIKEFNI